jgi:hypothetical protein
MKTRTLLLLALGCGLAILLAGGALLVMLAGQDDPEPATRVCCGTAVATIRRVGMSGLRSDDAWSDANGGDDTVIDDE